MTTTLIRNAAVVVTMDAARREWQGVDILIRDGVIAQIGAVTESANTVIDAGDCIVTPGLVNTHHHLYQSLTRAVPACQDAQLFDWLRALYPILGADDVRRLIRRRAIGSGGVGAFRLHHVGGSLVPFSQRRAA